MNPLQESLRVRRCLDDGVSLDARIESGERTSVPGFDEFDKRIGEARSEESSV